MKCEQAQSLCAQIQYIHECTTRTLPSFGSIPINKALTEVSGQGILKMMNLNVNTTITLMQHSRYWNWGTERDRLAHGYDELGCK
jgi:hypothetical protein